MGYCMNILERFQRAGVIFRLDDDKLRYRGADGPLAPDLAAEVRRHRDAILIALQNVGGPSTGERPEARTYRSYTCSTCDRPGLFPRPDVVCFWCREDAGNPNHEQQERDAIQTEGEA